MKRSDIDRMFLQDARRRKSLFTYVIMIAIFAAISCGFFFTYASLSKVKYVKYVENTKYF